MQLVAKFYALLGDCSSRDLELAADAVGRHSALGELFREMAKYRSRFGALGKENGAAPLVVDQDPGQVEFKAAPTENEAAIRARLREVIFSRRYFPTTSRLLEHLAKSGLQVKGLSKEGRARLYNRVTKLLNEKSPTERQQLLLRIFSVLPDSETARWFSVIRRTD
jgi:hypothetical protein